jgi:hypothetical protein
MVLGWIIDCGKKVVQSGHLGERHVSLLKESRPNSGLSGSAAALEEGPWPVDRAAERSGHKTAKSKGFSQTKGDSTCVLGISKPHS